MNVRAAALLAFAGLAPGASAVNTWLVDVTYSNPGGRITDPGDSATVSIWAQFDAEWYALAYVAFDVDTEDHGNGSWTDFGEVLNAPGSFDGSADADDVNGILSGQLYWPGSIFPDTSNPILVWHGTFTTEDLSYRLITLSTVTSAFEVWDDQVFTEDLLDSLVEGKGGIEVGFPAPGSGAFLALGALSAVRRRRETLS